MSTDQVQTHELRDVTNIINYNKKSIQYVMTEISFKDAVL